MRKSLMVILAILCIVPQVEAATHYVWCGAAGSATGADFTNAFTDLPASLVRGDTYVVAGSASCTYGPDRLDDTDSGTLVITVRKAEASLDSSVTGWLASFATAQAKFTEPANPDPESLTGNKDVVGICSSYYTFDGVTGNSDPSSGGPTGYGFLLQTPNALGQGILTVSSNAGCFHGDTAHTNITINGTEVSGVNTYASATVASCSLVGSTVTVGFSPVPSWTLVTGDLVDGFTNSVNGPIAVTDGSGHLATSMPVTSVTGSPNTSIQFTLTSGYVGNPCTQAGPVQFIGLASGGTALLYMINGATDTYSNSTVSNSYFHTTSVNPLVTAGLSNVTFTKDFFADNRFTPTFHANGVDDHVGVGLSSSNVTFSYDWWKDISGTAFIAIFNQGSGALQTDSNWNIYGNVFWHTNPSGAFSSLSGWIRCFGVSTQPVACSHFKIYNNTVYNLSNSAGHANLDLSQADPSSTDWEVYDNLWASSLNVQPNPTQWMASSPVPLNGKIQDSNGNVEQVTVAGTTASVHPAWPTTVGNTVADGTATWKLIALGGLTCFDETAACTSTSAMVQDYNFYDTNNTGSVSSDVHKATAAVTPATFWVNSASSDFRLAADGANLLNTDVLLHANTTDFFGNTRGADGTWDPGAFEFQATASRGGLELLNSAHPF